MYVWIILSVSLQCARSRFTLSSRNYKTDLYEHHERNENNCCNMEMNRIEKNCCRVRVRRVGSGVTARNSSTGCTRGAPAGDVSKFSARPNAATTICNFPRTCVAETSRENVCVRREGNHFVCTEPRRSTRCIRVILFCVLYVYFINQRDNRNALRRLVYLNNSQFSKSPRLGNIHTYVPVKAGFLSAVCFRV